MNVGLCHVNLTSLRCRLDSGYLSRKLEETFNLGIWGQYFLEKGRARGELTLKPEMLSFLILTQSHTAFERKCQERTFVAALSCGAVV